MVLNNNNVILCRITKTAKQDKVSYHDFIHGMSELEEWQN